MNSAKARTVLFEAGHLVELTARFQAHYGKYYTLNPGSPEAAWTLYDQILQCQSRIARLLDRESIDDLHHRHGKWWDRYEVMDVASASAVSTEAVNLIACCTCVSVHQPDQEWSYSVHTSQASIAGMLHPNSLQIASDESIQLQSN